MYVDSFQPADSELTVTIRNAVTGLIAVDYSGNQFENMKGSVNRTMGLGCIDISVYRR